jgi:hypothetical protein
VNAARLVWDEVINEKPVSTPSLSDMPVDALVSIYHCSGDIEAWLKKVEEHLFLLIAKSPKLIPTLKLVEGKSRRRWKDEEEAIDALVAAGLKRELIAPPKLAGITEIASLLPPKKREGIMEPLTIKPRGKPTITTKDDPRPAIQVDARDAFASEIEDQ